MLNLYELEQFVAFAELGTLLKVSEEFHLSTPTITRSMQHIEESFGVSLFSRTKNKIELNASGWKAVECAKNILQESKKAIQTVKDFDKSLKTIVVKSCAPAPLWKLLPILTSLFPNMQISSSTCQNDEILTSIKEENSDLVILPFPINENGYYCTFFMKEHLSVFSKKGHELSKYKNLSFSKINGHNFLLNSELGFWDVLCRNKMPSSKFLVQKNTFEFNELLFSSSLPCFVTEYSDSDLLLDKERIQIPLTDIEAHVSFYIITRDKNLFNNIVQNFHPENIG